ncbi:Uncharacterised protein [Mycobacteroides abscessus subsp. abscessus]|nr:Uncharacterised protein [Mycobacteroides abscessus subsp. abscessus]
MGEKSVCTKPGSMENTLMPVSARTFDKVIVRLLRAALEA